MGSLTVSEARTLECCEEDIERGGRLIFAAMRKIRDERLYRGAFGTFEEYCQGRWKMTRQHANRMIRHESVLANLEPIGSKLSEAASREIADLSADVQRHVVEVAADDLTAAALRHCREICTRAASAVGWTLEQAVRAVTTVREIDRLRELGQIEAAGVLRDRLNADKSLETCAAFKAAIARDRRRRETPTAADA